MKTVDQVEALPSDLPEEVRLWLFPRKRRKRSGRKNAETREIGKRVAHPAARLRDPAKNHRLLAVEIDDKPPGSFRKKSARGCMFMRSEERRVGKECTTRPAL